MTTPKKSVGVKLAPNYIKFNASGAATSGADVFKQRQAELKKTVSPPYTVAGKTLSPIGKEFQRLTLARDWDGLFNFLPSAQWGQYGMLGKYSFRDQNGVRTFIPFTESELQRFVFSPYYTVQPGWDCTDEQRAMGVAALTKAGAVHKAKFAATDWRSIWPIYPGWGYPGQRYGCEKYQPSTWVKIRKPVVAAAAIVTAVYLGPALLGKIKAMSAAKGVGTATGSGKILAGSKKLVGAVNKGRTIKAIAKGKLPPPPISIGGASWRQWAFLVAKDEMIKSGQTVGATEEAAMRIEIAQMQRELVATTPPMIQRAPAQPIQYLAPPIQAMQVREEQRADSNDQLLKTALVVGIPAALLFMGK